MRHIIAAILGIAIITSGCTTSQDREWIDLHNQRNWYVENYPESDSTWSINQIPLRQHLAYCASKEVEFHAPDSTHSPHAKCDHVNWGHEDASYGFYWIDK